MATDDVLIIGAGIGGLTCANALRRRRIPVQVYERAPELNEVGAGIWVPSNAMQVLERIGLDTDIEEQSLRLSAIEVRTADGGELHTISLQEIREQFGHGTQSIHRARLQKLLADSFGDENIHFGKQLVGLEQDDEGVTVRFADGSDARGRLVIGADGLRSAVRGELFKGVELRDSGQTCFRGIAKMRLPEELQTICRETWGRRYRFGFSPVGEGEVYWFAPITKPFDGGDDLRAALAEAYSDFPEPIPAILAETPPESILETELWDFEPMPQWCFGRVALLGDAAHATTPNLGQGAAQAIESAYVLARALATHPSHVEAFVAYEAIRKEKAHSVTKTSFTFGKTAQLENGVAVWFRDVALKSTPEFVNARQIEKLYGLEY